MDKKQEAAYSVTGQKQLDELIRGMIHTSKTFYTDYTVKYK